MAVMTAPVAPPRARFKPSLNGEHRMPALRLVEAPVNVRRFARLLTVIFFLVPFVLLFVPWQQTVTGSGRVIALDPAEREQTVDAPLTGRIQKWYVLEGDEVQAGQKLVDIVDNDPELVNRLKLELEAFAKRRDAGERRVKNLEGQTDQLTASQKRGLAAFDNRLDMAKKRLEAARQSVDAARISHQTARFNQERQALLEREGIASQRTRELADLEFGRTRAGLETAQQLLDAARSEIGAVQEDKEKFRNDNEAAIQAIQASREAALADVEAARAEITRIETRLARQENGMAVLAPCAGRVLRLEANASRGGEIVKEGDRLAVLVPDVTGQRAVSLWVEGNDTPLVTVGSKVRLQFEGWPAVQFSGWPSVAVGTFGGEVQLVDATDNGKGKFRILVVPDPQDPEPWPSERFLRQGVRANGWVLLQQVTMGWELWRRVNGFPQTLPEEPGESGKKGKDAK